MGEEIIPYSDKRVVQVDTKFLANFVALCESVEPSKMDLALQMACKINKIEPMKVKIAQRIALEDYIKEQSLEWKPKMNANYILSKLPKAEIRYREIVEQKMGEQNEEK